MKEKTFPPSRLKKSPIIDFPSVEGLASIARDIDAAYKLVEKEEDADDDDEGLYMAGWRSKSQEEPKSRGSASSAATGGAVQAKDSAGRVNDRREERRGNG